MKRSQASRAAPRQAEVAALVAKYRERYGDVGYAENVLYPGIADALVALRRAGLPLGLCTSKRGDFAERILEMFGLREHFEFVSGGDIGTPKWRQIEGLLRSGQVSEASVMVGDRAIDVEAAHRNGLHAAGVLWGYGSAAELAQARPRYSFASPADLRELAVGPATMPPIAPGELTMNGAESLIRSFVDAGVTCCFANPGTSEMHLVQAIDAVPQMRACSRCSKASAAAPRMATDGCAACRR